jgi:predicted permease
MSLLDTVFRDVRHGARALGRTPAFTAAAVLTLALGIGANTAIFSIVNAVLLAPLPYAQAERRVQIWSKWTAFEKTWLSDAEVLDYRTRVRAFESVAAWSSTQANLTGDGEPVRVGAARITTNTFDVLGAALLAGRGFSDAEAGPTPAPVVVIGHGLWQRRYGGDPSVLGRTLLVNGQAHEVVGIMPPGFQLPTDFTEDVAAPSQLWLPLGLDPQNRGNHGLYGAAVLAPGATARQATTELQALTTALTGEGLYPPAMQFSAFAVPIDDEILASVRPAILLLFGAVGFLLLIACANVANLLLARAEGRQREVAVRTALGASQWRLLRQLLTESVVLALVSTTLGVGLAWAGIRALTAIDPADIPRVATVAVDARVLAFTAVAGILTTVLFSLAPSLRALRVSLTDALKEGGQQATTGAARGRLRDLLVVAEVALAVVLVIGAGLMIRSLWALQRIDIGFDPERVLTVELSLPASDYPETEQVVGFYGRLLERVRALPGVRHAGLIRSLPLGSTIGDWGLDVDGFAESPGNNAKGDWQIASDGALEALGERLVEGRTFAASDTSDSQLVAVVNQTLARRYFPDGRALGGRIRLGNARNPWVTVVGIVADVKHNELTGIVKEKFYVPHSQWHRSTGGPRRAMTVVVKTTGDPLQLASPVRAEVARLDPNLPVANVRTLSQVVGAAMATSRFTGTLLSLFAAVALALAAIGIYGVMSYVVSRRTHEIGIRMAVGADRWQVLRLVLGRGLALSLAGIALGVASALGVTRLMTTLLYNVAPTDPVTFVAVPLLLCLVALVASYVPALRATRVDPLSALRTE